MGEGRESIRLFPQPEDKGQEVEQEPSPLPGVTFELTKEFLYENGQLPVKYIEGMDDRLSSWEELSDYTCKRRQEFLEDKGLATITDLDDFANRLSQLSSEYWASKAEELGLPDRTHTTNEVVPEHVRKQRRLMLETGLASFERPLPPIIS